MVSLIIKMFFFSLGMAGTWMLFGKWIGNYFASRKASRRMRLKHKKGGSDPRITEKEHPIIYKLKFMVEFAHRGKVTFTTYCFILLMFFSFSMLFLYTMDNLSVTNVLFSVLLLALPVSFTIAKFYFARLESSYEGERLVVEFINQYRINSANVVETVNKTAQSLKEELYSKAALNRLYFALNNVRNNEDREKALMEFAYAIDTQWSKLLSHNILSALVSGVDISESLEDILQEIKSIKESIEKSKRDNNEGYKVGVFLAPIIYVGTTYFGMRAMDMNFREYLNAQFGSDAGYKLIIVIGIIYAASVIFSRVLKKPKFD